MPAERTFLLLPEDEYTLISGPVFKIQYPVALVKHFAEGRKE